ncbi:MAG: DUF6262 family protein [Thalassolituus sp.]|jgi:peptidoglycan hydrolase CwlO-like protein|uniref:DUF6262 family protein n=1 Tax=Thalassolituus sp. TaxID=2030822 RepID=UPI003982A12B
MANRNPSNIKAHEAKRAISREKYDEVKKQIQYCVNANEKVTLLGIAKRAGVSRAFIYNSAELRDLIENHKELTSNRAVSNSLSSRRDQQKIKSLQNKLEAVIAKSKNQSSEVERLRKEITVLKQHIERLTRESNVVPIG